MVKLQSEEHVVLIQADAVFPIPLCVNIFCIVKEKMKEKRGLYRFYRNFQTRRDLNHWSLCPLNKTQIVETLTASSSPG